MTSGIRTIFVDTNVLLYAANRTSPWYREASQALQDAHNAGIELVISSQVSSLKVGVKKEQKKAG